MSLKIQPARRAFFAWEFGLRGPTPVVYYDEIPTVNGKRRSLLASHEIPGGTGNSDAFPSEAESPSFSTLATMYPAPVHEASNA